MSELHDKARVLLALRKNTTPAPWYAVGRMIECGDGVPDPGCCMPEYYGQGHLRSSDKREVANAAFMGAAHDMADMIAALLAENERLQAAPLVPTATQIDALMNEVRRWGWKWKNAEILAKFPAMLAVAPEVPRG